jgi:hypothetical protein
MTYALTALASSSALLFLTVLANFAVEFSALNLKTKDRVGGFLDVASATLLVVPALTLAAALAFQFIFRVTT